VPTGVRNKNSESRFYLIGLIANLFARLTNRSFSVRFNGEGCRISDHSGHEPWTVSTEFALLHNSHLNSERALWNRLSSEGDGDNIETSLCGFVGVFVCCADLL